MKLLASLFILLAVSAFGAQTDYKCFRGIGGIIIVSNPPTGTIIIDGSGISSPTGGVSAATATNIAQYFGTNSTGKPAAPISSIQYNSNGVMQGSSALLFTNGAITGTTGLAINVNSGRIALFSDNPGVGGEFFDVTPTLQIPSAQDDFGARVFFQVANENTSHNFKNGAILGELFTPSNNSQNYATWQQGLYGYVHHSGSGRLSLSAGVYGIGGIYGNGTILNSYGGWFRSLIASGSGNIGDSIALFAENGLNSGSGVITNAYGLRLAEQTVGASNNWTMYSEGGKIGVVVGPLCIGSAPTNSGNGRIILATGTGPTNGIAFGTGATENLYKFFAGALKTDGILYVAGTINAGDDIVPTTDTALDVGTAALRFRNGNFNGRVVANNSFHTFGLDATNGSVGIGTTVPSSTLDVTGQVRAASAYITNSIVLAGTITANQLNAGTIKAAGSAGISILYVTNLAGSGDIVMVEADGKLGRTNISGGTPTLPSPLWVTNGFVGIGNPSPLSMLSVSNTTATANSFRVHSSNNPTPAFQIASNGAVSIGTASFVSGAALTIAGPVKMLNDNTDDWGASGANRIRSLFVGTTVNAATLTASSGINAGAAGFIGFSTKTYLDSPSDGVLRAANNATTDFNRLDLGGTTAAFPAIGRQFGDVVVLGADGNPAASTNRLIATGGLVVGPTNSTATLTNTLYASATLDFPSTAAGTASDLPITVVGAADGNIVSLGIPTGSIGPLSGTYAAWASNGVVYVRYANNNLVTAQDPASGLFSVRVDKFK